MTVKATSNLSLDERSASFSIISDEVLGTKAVKEMFVTQESLAEGGPLEGLDAPVKWFFNGASGTDYTAMKQPEKEGYPQYLLCGQRPFRRRPSGGHRPHRRR